MNRFLRLSILALATAGVLTPAMAEDYPNKPVKLIVPFSPGAGTDATGRVVAEGLAKRFNQAVVVENKPGAGSAIGVDTVLKSTPDGYTLLYGTADGITVLPATNPKLPYKIPNDITFLARTFTMPFTIAVSNALPVKTWDEFVAYGKAHPGKLRYATSGVGTGGHLATVLLEDAIGVKMTHVPYKGVGQFIPDLLSGTVDVGLVTPPTINPHYTTGKVKVLAQTGNKKHMLLPNVPTLPELGLQKAVVEVWYGVMAPAGLPANLKTKLIGDLKAVVEDPDILAKLKKIGWVPDPMYGDDFRKFATDEMNVWMDVAKKGNIVVEQ
jgi:tripartite-type tricarboxylate transporter receptor subunit TctC